MNKAGNPSASAISTKQTFDAPLEHLGQRHAVATNRRAWYIVGTFSALLGIAHFDRFILSLLATPITQEFGLSDREMGLLLGFSFSLVYSIAGLPIAYYLDRGNRIYGVAAGVLIWSSATIGSAFVDSYGQLLVLRAGVAVGEAVLTPAMISLLADLFEPRERARPTGLYLAAGTIMAGGAFVVGGLMIQLAESIHIHLTDLAPWRITLIFVGLPGILVVLPVLATIREPGRRPAQKRATDQVDVFSLLQHLRNHVAFYVPLYFVIGLGVSIGMAIFAWMPTVLMRSYGFDLGASGYMFGMAVTPAIVLGTLFWTCLIGRIGFASSGPILALLAAVVIVVVGALVNVAFGSSTAIIAACALMSVGTASFTPVAALIVQQVTPPHMHARLMATVLFAANVIGAGVGPLAPAFLAELWSADPRALGHALFAYILVVCAVLIPALVICRRGYVRFQQAAPV